jgi:anti-sigma-K factor RskA
MEKNRTLDDWIAAARADLSERQPDQLAEQQLLTRVREMRALQSVAATRIAAPVSVDKAHGSWRRVFGWRAAALACVITLMAALGVVVLLPNVPTRDATVRTPFLALVASEALAAEPSALLVSSEVPGSALSDYGLPVDPARIDQSVRAEFLLSPTGLLLAVRFAE